jgi:hypothetical protein
MQNAACRIADKKVSVILSAEKNLKRKRDASPIIATDKRKKFL